MTGWMKVCCFADGVIYAWGNKRKVVIPGNLDVYYEAKAQEIRWYRPASIHKASRETDHRLEG